MNADNIVEHEFKPGQSGNPNGRPKGRKNIKTMLKELLSAQDSNGEWAKAPAMQLIKKAFKDNDLRAIVEIIDRIEGKAEQKVQFEGDIKYSEKFTKHAGLISERFGIPLS